VVEVQHGSNAAPVELVENPLHVRLSKTRREVVRLVDKRHLPRERRSRDQAGVNDLHFGIAQAMR
jgi:hypothetical protein